VETTVYSGDEMSSILKVRPWNETEDHDSVSLKSTSLMERRGMFQCAALRVIKALLSLLSIPAGSDRSSTRREVNCFCKI
jgi:hypothetical protein